MVDAGILEQVLYHLHNWFGRASISATGCTIADGALPASIASSMVEGAWYRIEGSLLNDGLHKHPADDLQDETFDGTITVCAIPRALLNVVEEITDYIDATNESDAAVRGAIFQSESFGGYTYSLKGDSRSGSASGGGSGLTGWQAAFRTDLNPWRKIA